MAEELAEGLFRGIFAVLRAVVGFLLDVLREVLAEVVVRGLVYAVTAIFRAIGRLIDFAVWLIEAALYLVLRRPIGKRTAVVYALAFALLMAGGFGLGATASVLYHADWSTAQVAASSALER